MSRQLNFTFNIVDSKLKQSFNLKQHVQYDNSSQLK